MDIVKELWDNRVLGGMFSTLITCFGQLSAMNSQKFSAVVDVLKATQNNDAIVHDTAFQRSGDGGVFIRRTMLFMGFFMLGVCPLIFAFWQDIPVAVESAIQSGGWFWGLFPEREKLAIAYVNGFYLSEIWKDLMANLISAYIGAGIARRAFSLGK